MKEIGYWLLVFLLAGLFILWFGLMFAAGLWVIKNLLMCAWTGPILMLIALVMLANKLHKGR